MKMIAIPASKTGMILDGLTVLPARYVEFQAARYDKLERVQVHFRA
jgi:hypothetical protein